MDDRVRVLYVVGDLGRGGAQKQLYLLLKHMDRRAFAPTVVTLAEGGLWTEPVRALGVPVVELTRRRSLELGRFFGLWRAVRRTAPAILQTLLFSDHAYGLLAGRLAGVPILVTSRRIDRYGEATSVLRKLSQLLWRWADATICNAERSRESAPPSLVARHTVIPNGIEPDLPTRTRGDVRRELGLSEDAIVVGGLGRLVAQKNQALWIDVAADVVRTRPETRFLLVGGGPLEAELRGQISRLGIEDAVILTGDRSDVADVMGAMDIFLLTSDREGMSNATMEAMSLGLPCVVTDAGGAGELIVDGQSGYVCRRGDRATLADRLGRLLDDPQLRRRLGSSARDRVHDLFSPERMARSTEALYRRLLSAKHPRAGAATVEAARTSADGVAR